MLKVDEDALVCDLAEVYQIYNYKELPPTQVAVFAIGLNYNSRIMMKMNGQKVPLNVHLTAGILDRLSWIVWSKTKDGQKGVNQPASIVDILSGKHAEETKDIVTFNSGKEFEEYRKQLIGGG